MMVQDQVASRSSGARDTQVRSKRYCLVFFDNGQARRNGLQSGASICDMLKEALEVDIYLIIG